MILRRGLTLHKIQLESILGVRSFCLFHQERLREEEERLHRIKQAEMYRLGDSDLEVIKR